MSGDPETPKVSRYRTLQGPLARLGEVMLIAPLLIGSLWALQVQNWVGLLLFKEQFLAIMLGLALMATFLLVKPRPGSNPTGVAWFDWILIVASGVCMGYVLINYNAIVHDLASLAPERIILGGVSILLVFEATRRLVGWTLIWVALFFLVYAAFGHLMPGIFAVPSSSFERIAVYSYLDNGALLGVPIDVAASTIVTFILFGGVLQAVKGDTFITDLALVAMGRYRGGPAKVSVVASTLFGTVSGSAVSNVAVVGPISIPMMTKAGYPPHQAAAVEAVSSTGGQIMPPVMGITAFLMADFLGVPYADIVLAALIPALLYYAAVFFQVDLEAGKRGLKGLALADLPKLLPTLKEGVVFVIPLCVLIYGVMIAYWSPGLAGLAAAGAALVVGCLRARNRPTLVGLWAMALRTGHTVLDILVMTAVAGLVIGALQLSGLSFSMSFILVELAGNNVVLILVITAFVCIILGMALPTAVIYTMLAVLVAPALTQLGVDQMAAHFFIFYMGMLSMITPPVCFATFTAASIARSGFWITSFSGMRFGIVAYILPFFFPFSLGLLMQGGFWDVSLSVGTALIGTWALACGLVGYFTRPLSIPARIILMICALGVMPSPTLGQSMLILNLGCLGVIGALFAFEWFAARRAGPQVTEAIR